VAPEVAPLADGEALSEEDEGDLGDDAERRCAFTGEPHLQENATPEDPTVGLYLGSYGGPWGVGVFTWARNPCRNFGFGTLCLMQSHHSRSPDPSVENTEQLRPRVVNKVILST